MLKKLVVVGLAVVAVWFVLPSWLPFLRSCPLAVYGHAVSYAALLAVAVGILGWRMQAR